MGAVIITLSFFKILQPLVREVIPISIAADVITGDMLIADGGQWLVGNAFYQAGKQFLDGWS